MTNANTEIYEFGKWVETNVISILSKRFNFEIVQTKDKFCNIDAMIYRLQKVSPCQIKAYAPRVIFSDISISIEMYRRYKQIAETNGGYYVFQINTAYNPKRYLDYGVYLFDILTIPIEIKAFSQYDKSEHVFFKYSDMTYVDCLPIEFQKEMEKLKYELNPPSEKYKDLYYKKF